MADLPQAAQGGQQASSDVVGASAHPLGITWRNRRRAMWSALVFCMASIAYVLVMRLESSVAETTVTMSFLSIMSIIGSYVFGAAWQDVTQIKVSK